MKPDRLTQWGAFTAPETGLLPGQAGIWTSYGKAIGEAFLS